ncbi:permease [Ferrimonas balearica]|uniref:permease n=1 Tax=Ferrimonas balearica TaxID=44012 RepID=UPI001C996D8D|nr:permease [Ferrimonas balearica]MBY5921735.1 permease [Ferrimonas balearica]MBY5994925.1 permease [Ferrimonas balearica]
MNPDFLTQSGSFSDQLLSALYMFVYLMAEISILFLVISSLVGVINQKLPKEKVQALLGGRGGRGYFMAAGLGGLTPFCSCSTIPMLIGLLKARAGFGPTMTFLITSPLLNPLVIALFLPVFGVKVTLIYALLALTVAIVAGMVLQALGFERYIKSELLKDPAAQSSCCDSTKAAPADAAEESCCAPKAEATAESCCAPKAEAKAESCCASEPVAPVFQRMTPVAAEGCCGAAEPVPVTQKPAKTRIDWPKAGREGLALYRSMLPYMALAMAIGALVHGFVPSEFFANVAGADNPWAIPVAAVIGIPLYIRVEALLPLVGSLVAKGVSLGAVMALTIGSGGASIPELIMLKRLFRWPLLMAFVATILVMAIGGGLIFNLVA